MRKKCSVLRKIYLKHKRGIKTSSYRQKWRELITSTPTIEGILKEVPHKEIGYKSESLEMKNFGNGTCHYEISQHQRRRDP